MQEFETSAPISISAAVRLKTNFLWMLAGNITYAACQWAMIVILARLGTPQVVGQFALALAITAPVFMLANLQLRGVQATDASRQYEFCDYFGLRLLTSAVAILAIAALTFSSGYKRETALVILAVGFSKGFESLSDLFYGLQQQHEEFRHVARSMMLKGIVSLAVLGCVFRLTGELLWGVAGLMAVWAIVFAAYDAYNGRAILRRGRHQQHDWRPRFHKQTLFRLVALALPLGLVMVLNSLGTNIPRYFIAHYLGEQELGIFAAMAYVMVGGGTIVSALGDSVSPRLARHYAAGDVSAFRTLLVKLVAAVSVIGGAGVVAASVKGSAILSLLYNDEYARHGRTFVWIMLAAGFSFISSLFGYSITAARRFKVQVPLNLVFIIVLTAGSAILIPKYGIDGAAVALCLSVAFQLPLKALIIYLALKTNQRIACAGAIEVPIKILHVFGRMQRGGAEMRTLDLMRTADRRRFNFHFCALSGLRGDLDDEIRGLGGEVHLTKLDLWFPWRFRSLLRRHRFDVVHSHVHYFSGLVLKLAAKQGVPHRITHFRITNDCQDNSLRRRLQRRLMRLWVSRYSTRILSVSQGAMEESWGKRWCQDKRCQVIYNGLDTSRFPATSDPSEVRGEFDLPEHCRLYIHVGRMDPQKNHKRLLAIFAQIAADDPQACLLLVGRGGNEIEEWLRGCARELGLADRIKFAGVRADVPRLLKAADLMIFPSVVEGLPGAVLEAGAVGTPVLASDLPGIVEIAARLPLVRFLSLGAPDIQWAESARRLCDEASATGVRDRAAREFSESIFTIDDCVRAHTTVWEESRLNA